MNPKKDKRSGMTIPEMAIVSAITVTLAVVVVPAVLHVNRDMKIKAMQNTFLLIQETLNDIYVDQLPHEYPPEDKLPDKVATWVAPVNLQNAYTLEELLQRYCKEFASLQLNPNGEYRCIYEIIHTGTASGSSAPPDGGLPEEGGASQGGIGDSSPLTSYISGITDPFRMTLQKEVDDVVKEKVCITPEKVMKWELGVVAPEDDILCGVGETLWLSGGPAVPTEMKSGVDLISAASDCTTTTADTLNPDCTGSSSTIGSDLDVGSAPPLTPPTFGEPGFDPTDPIKRDQPPWP